MKKIGLRLLTFVGFCVVFAGSSAFAASPSDIHITSDGSFNATNMVVYQKSGQSVLFTRVTWDSTFVRVTLLVKPDTQIIKAHGEKGSIDDVKEWDVLNVEGTLASSEGGLSVNAKKITDTSLQVESKTVSGFISSVNSNTSSFILPNKIFGNSTTVLVGTTTVIKKGARTINQGELLKGDKILSVNGAYNYKTNVLSATNVDVYQDKSVFLTRNFQGTLKSISGTALPVTAVINVDGINYDVYFATGSSVLNNAKGVASLSRFVAGDTVRFNGKVREMNLSQIDATVFRDLNF